MAHPHPHPPPPGPPPARFLFNRLYSRAVLPRPPSELSTPPLPLSPYSSWLEPGRAAARVPPDLPACSSDHYRIQKHVDHTSVRLLRYRLLVQGTRAGKGGREGGGKARRKPFEISGLALCPRLWESFPRLDFWVREKSWSLQCVFSRLVGGEKEKRGRAGGSSCSCLVSPQPTTATLPGASRTGFAPPRPAAHG